MTKKYIGTKIITAWSQDKDGTPGYAVKYEDGFVSWSPKEVFDKAYRACEGSIQNLTFSDALHFVKMGKRVARVGWNGKGMWLQVVRGSNVQIHNMGFGPANEYDHDWRSRVPELSSWIGMKTADNKFVPWLASQSDMLADDWMVL